MPLFIRQNDTLPVSRLGYGPNHVAFEFRGNKLFVADDDTDLLFALRSAGYEEVASEDPRYDFIATEGWGRLAQRDYLAANPTPPPEE
jgi:hypothetical protein